MAPIRVTYFHRRPDACHFSIERLFSQVRAAMPPSVICLVATCQFISRGFFPRIYNLVEAAFRQSEINHVTGDVHYLTYFMRRRRTVLTVNDCVSLERLSGIKRLVMRTLWYDIPLRRCALITVISESSRHELLRHVRCDPARIRVIPCCVSPTFTPSPGQFRDEEPLILQVGTSENKNVIRLVHALAGIPCHLRLVGALSAAQMTVLNARSVRFSNSVSLSDEDLLEEYRRCDMVAFVSTYEGFGIPILEANAIGRPLVTSNILSMPEVAGGAACLVDPYDVSSIREGFLRVISDSNYRERLVSVGYQNVQRYTPESVANEYVRLYEELLRKNAS